VTACLAIETSSPTYGAAVSVDGEVRAYRMAHRTEFENVGELTRSVLEEAGIAVGDLELFAVNIGPGYLTSVRAGVAYVNALSFGGGGLPIRVVDSLRLLALQASQLDSSAPVLSLRNAPGGEVFGGLFTSDGAKSYRVGKFREVVAGLAGELSSVVVAGVSRTEVKDVLHGCDVTDSGVETSTVLTLHEAAVVRSLHDDVKLALPLTENSQIFHG
jgi:tRNA threonylcarbamoyl adenosine modification protein YeaZ